MLGEFLGIFYGVYAQILKGKSYFISQFFWQAILHNHHKNFSVFASDPAGNGPGEKK
jgi:hypothetical protein